MAQIAGMPVAWRASKQPIITLSVAEAELYEGCAAVQLGLGVAALLSELQLNPVMHLSLSGGVLRCVLKAERVAHCTPQPLEL